MNERAPHDPDPNAEANDAPDSPDFIKAMQAKRRALQASLAGAGGLLPGIHGIMTVEEDVFGDRLLGPEECKSKARS